MKVKILAALAGLGILVQQYMVWGLCAYCPIRAGAEDFLHASAVFLVGADVFSDGLRVVNSLPVQTG